MQQASQEMLPKRKSIDYYSVITRRVIKELEQGRLPWRKQWKFPCWGFAKNYHSGHQYKGINWLLLNLMTAYEIPYYLTLSQVIRQGGNVLEGTKPEEVFYYNTYYKNGAGEVIPYMRAKQLESEQEEIQRISYLRKHKLFNLSKIKGIPWKKTNLPSIEKSELERCDQLLSKMKEKPRLVYQDEFDAYYNVITDSIVLPQLKTFDEPLSYYLVLFHKLINWTGHIKRLARESVMDSTLGNQRIYVEETLISEIGATMLCGLMGINQTDQLEVGSDYVTLWIQAMEEDKRFLFRVASRAQRAVDYILRGTIYNEV